VSCRSFGPNFLDTSFGPQYEYELGPLTLGYERWANLPPSEIRLQSFGYAAVDEEGVLTIQLIGIDGTVNYEKVLTPDTVSTPSPPAECKSIAAIACSEDQASTFSILCSLVQAQGLGGALDEGTWTVFAPTNDAFSNLFGGIPLAKVEDMLLFHAVADVTIMSKDLVCKETVAMANGKSSRTTCDNNQNPSRFFQRGSDNTDDAIPEIIEADIMACNGVIHVIDNVMLPSGFLPDVQLNSGN
jgi:uncharacterized surface protein with fasciclin (FAS1) repeats